MAVHTLQWKGSASQPAPVLLSWSRNVKYSRNLNLHAKDEGEKFPASQVLSKFLEAKQKVSGIFAGGYEIWSFSTPTRSLLSHKFTPTIYTIMNLLKKGKVSGWSGTRCLWNEECLCTKRRNIFRPRPSDEMPWISDSTVGTSDWGKFDPFSVGVTKSFPEMKSFAFSEYFL